MNRLWPALGALVLIVAAGASAAADAVQLICACGDSETPINQELAAFMAANPDIQVAAADKGKYSGKLAVYAASGTGPDLIWVDNQEVADWGSQGILADLAPLIQRDKSEVQPADFFPGSLEHLAYGGATYALPSWFASSGLYYNKSLFDAAGVGYPNADWTWNNLTVEGKKLAKMDASGQITQFAYTPDGFAFNWSTGPTIWVWSNGGRLVSDDQKQFLLNSDAARQALNTYDDIIFNEGLAVTPVYQAKQTWWDRFFNGTIAIWDSPSWNNTGIADAAVQHHFGWDVAPTLKSPYTGQRAAFVYVRGFAMLDSSKHKEAAWKLMKFLTSRQLESERAKLGTQPTRQSAANDWLQFKPGGSRVNLQPFIDALGPGRYIPVIGNGQTNAAFWNTLTNNWNKVLDRKIPVNEFLDTVTPVMNQLLSGAGK